MRPATTKHCCASDLHGSHLNYCCHICANDLAFEFTLNVTVGMYKLKAEFKKFDIVNGYL